MISLYMYIIMKVDNRAFSLNYQVIYKIKKRLYGNVCVRQRRPREGWRMIVMSLASVIQERAVNAALSLTVVSSSLALNRPWSLAWRC